MKFALISPNETVFKYDGTELGARVAQVELSENMFAVADPLFWIECDDAVVADQWYWDGPSLIEVPAAPAYQTAPIEVVPNGGPSIVA